MTHPSGVIHPSAVLGSRVCVGPFTTIGAGVEIGDGTEVGANVTIEAGTVIGKNCRIFHGASLGGDPQILDFEKGISSTVKIGESTVVREFVTVHRSAVEQGVTEVGSHCMLMAYCHVAHDCRLGDHVVLVNYTGLPGHIQVGDGAFISGLVGIHQFVRIGKYAMIGGMAAVRKDVLPFSLVEGNPARLVSLNAVGLRRNGFPPKARSAIKGALKLLRQPDLNTSQAVEKIETEIEMSGEIRYLVNFIKESSRGITK